MSPEEFAARLDGREYLSEITRDEERLAEQAGLVVVFGASDDLMEFRGAINDELNAWDGTTARVTPLGLLPDWDQIESEEEAEHYFEMKRAGWQEIKAVWNDDGIPWSYRTEIPHATFDVMEDGEVYCRGIVFRLADVKGGE